MQLRNDNRNGTAGERQQAVAAGEARLRRILVVNAKGGCGKTTVTTNLAGWYAANGYPVALFDHDPQGSSMQWLSLRDDREPRIHGVAVHRRMAGQTRSYAMRVPPETLRIILDAPAGVTGPDLVDLVREVDTLIIPVLPSPFDMHATAHFIRDLLLVGKVRSRSIRVGVVANRVRKNTLVYQSLSRFLRSLDIPFIAQLRDTQNYVRAAEEGLSVCEVGGPGTGADRRHWRQLIDWIEAGAPVSVGDRPGS